MAYRIVYWNTKQLEKDLYRAHTYDTGLTTAINFKSGCTYHELYPRQQKHNDL